MAKTHYREWNYDTGKITEYARSGECNGCGDCCIALIRYRFARLKGRKGGNWGHMGIGTSHKGIWYEIKEGKRSRTMQPLETAMRPRKEACSMLQENNQCAVHDQKDWKRDIATLCDVWPINPEQIKPFDKCSYVFTVIGEWDIETDG